MTAADSTYFPPGSDDLGTVEDFLAAYRARKGEDPEPQFFLSGPDRDDHVPLPPELYRILVDAVASLQRGMAVTIHPNNLTITTQEAADILGVSRPTVIRMIDSGKLSAQRIHRHRRLRLSDVIALRDQHRDEQMDYIAASHDETPPPSREEYRQARAKIMRRRRADRSGE